MSPELCQHRRPICRKSPRSEAAHKAMLSKSAPAGYRKGMTNTVYQNDLPGSGWKLGPIGREIDCEKPMAASAPRSAFVFGNSLWRWQHAHLIQICQRPGPEDALICAPCFEDPHVLKLYSTYGRFDIARAEHLWCTPHGLLPTKIAAALCATYTDRPACQNLCQENC